MNVHRISPAFPESLDPKGGFVIVALVAVSRAEMEVIARLCPQRPLDLCKHLITPIVNARLDGLRDEMAEASKEVEYIGPRNQADPPEGTDREE